MTKININVEYVIQKHIVNMIDINIVVQFANQISEIIKYEKNVNMINVKIAVLFVLVVNIKN
jgi:hypothetical protein